MRFARLLLVVLLSSPPAFAVEMGDSNVGMLKEQNLIKREAEEKIQTGILDPILGKGKAMAFVDVEMDFKTETESSNRTGMGLAEKYQEKLAKDESEGPQTTFVLPGIPKPRTISGGENKALRRPESVRAKQSQQIRGVQEDRFVIKQIFKKMTVTVVHDEAVLKDKAQQKKIRGLIVDTMKQYNLTQDLVLFRPTKFNQTAKDWLEELQKPEVYLPLLFASLLLLLLMFLFGPLARFFRQYVAALREKPGAEVNIESKMEAPEEKEGGGKGPLDEEGKLDITYQSKPPPEEDEAMKKFEPFIYINEENIKRLVYMFLLSKEEPWVIAVVVSYLRPDYARMVLTALPAELQAKVAIEALTVRQITKEQVVAIDNDVKDRVDFVVGGIERLTTMLDDADSATRNNILNYLKIEKPAIYDRVRKAILIFDDVVTFPDRDMQTIVRELKTEGMARALQNAPPEIIEKFFSNMSTGAASLLKESMEYSRGLTDDQIDEERGKILDLVKVLEKEGKIAVRQKVGDGMDFMDIEEEVGAPTSRADRVASAQKKMDSKEGAAPAGASAPAQDPAQAQTYFQAGIGYHDAGQMEQAVQYLEYALGLDPNLWQAHQYLGAAKMSLGRNPEAIAHYEKVLQFNPDPQLRSWLDGMKAQTGG